VDEVTSRKNTLKKQLTVVALAVLVILALIGSFSAGSATAARPGLVPVVAENAQSEVLGAPREVPSGPIIPTRIRTCSISDLAGSSELGVFSGVVLDPYTGEVLFSRNQEQAVPPASVMKIVTATAALLVLGPDASFATTIKATDDPKTVLLVGGGDPTLSRLEPGANTVYPGAPTLKDLAEQTIAALQAGLEEGEDVSITELVIDESLWGVDASWDSSWATSARSMGFISLISPLQVDGDRANPADLVSPRGNNPAKRAGDAFVQALREAGNKARFVRVVSGQATPGATTLATVQSRPLSELVGLVLKNSDNTLAETVARHVSFELGLGGARDSLGQALLGPMSGLGMTSEGVSFQDGSGLSPLNRVTPEFVAQLLAEISLNEVGLEPIATGLPIAGVDGSLKERFVGDNSVAWDRVSAKTGRLSEVQSLAGFVKPGDEPELVFAFFAEGNLGDGARQALDTLVVGVLECGSNLADF
jgi:D-alanyl-D-alanine carboxypeptidase/D-alanyl-D-alanine-endopeptidase (penicillin-binding protein 4)